MTFQTSAWAVDGNPTAGLNGNFLRMMLGAASEGQQGVVGALDCLVNQTGTPSSGIIITPGSCIVAGVEVTQQGSYFGENVGNDTTLTIAATGGSIRSDMVIVRAEDPTFGGSTWPGPASGQILYPRVLSNVGAGATTVPGGYSAIPLARIDMPVSTTNVLQSYINDLRAVANPQQKVGFQSLNGSGSTVTTTAATATAWPPSASWSVPVPTWATMMAVTWHINEVTYTAHSNTLNGTVGPIFGASVGSPTLTFPQVPFHGISTTPMSGRHSLSGGGLVSVGPSLRGTSQTLQFSQIGDGVATDTLTWETGSYVQIFYQFQQVAALT
jgi:hypothetical protein